MANIINIFSAVELVGRERHSAKHVVGDHCWMSCGDSMKLYLKMRSTVNEGGPDCEVGRIGRPGCHGRAPSMK